MRHLVRCAGAVLLIALAATSCRTAAGTRSEYGSGDTSFTMIGVPALEFPTGNDNSGRSRVERPFEIARTETTWRLWTAVYEWAVSPDRGDLVYRFANPGQEGGSFDGPAPDATDLHPVTGVNWRDALVWTNALTEWHNAVHGTDFTPAYYRDDAYTQPLRDSGDGVFADSTDPSRGSFDDPIVRPDATGFRLPYSDEWELAARFIGDENRDGDIVDVGEYYRGTYTSGARDTYVNLEATSLVCWYGMNSGDTTHPVAQLGANALGLYDMSGNAYEWCFDIMPQSAQVLRRTIRGGSWASGQRQIPVAVTFYGGIDPYVENNQIGFRIVRSR